MKATRKTVLVLLKKADLENYSARYFINIYYCYLVQVQLRDFLLHPTATKDQKYSIFLQYIQ